MNALLRRLLPFAVSLSLVAYLAATIDLRAALDHLSFATALRFAGPLLLWNLATLAIESHCLYRVTAACGAPIAHFEAARMKAACYLLNLLHYTAGAAALSWLLRRRMQTGLGIAVSAVFLIALLDMGSVIGLAAAAAAALPDADTALRGGLLAGLAFAVVGGFVFLRAPLRLGPLEPLRALPVLQAARTIPTRWLVELAGLRVVFVASYVALTAALFRAFDVEFELVALAMKVALLLAISAVPIAAAGIGTAQLAFVTLFRGSAPDAELLSMSVLLSLGLTLGRALLGLAFARELARDAVALQSSRRGPKISPS